MHRVFISYHHSNDQTYKDDLIEFGIQNKIFMDGSVDTGEISDDLDDQSIRQIIRDDYLRDTSVTIVLIGTETRNRKHVDWEIYSSMFDGKVNKKSGLLVINLPSVNCRPIRTTHDNEMEIVYPEIKNWIQPKYRSEYKELFPFMPDRLLDNLVLPKSNISVTNWDKLNVTTLQFLIDATFNDRITSEYDLSRPMRRNNL